VVSLTCSGALSISIRFAKASGATGYERQAIVPLVITIRMAILRVLQQETGGC
jgi:hypothetical protein